MQKKRIALAAVAALVSSIAFAQSNVTIYGTVDMGFAHRSHNMTPGVKSQNAINSGQSAASMLGFKGVEDLGNGNQALFVLEAGFQTDDGTHSDSSFFNEQAYLGLTGDWGTAIAGRLIAPRFEFLAVIDPFGSDSMGRFGNVYEDHQPLGVSVANIDRVNNAVAYVSPDFSGFNVTAAYATNGIDQEQPGNSTDARVYTLLPRYTNGPLDIGLAWQRVSFKDAKNLPIPGNSKLTLDQWTLGASYDFDAVKLSVAYDDFKQQMSSGLYHPRMKSWLFGLSVPFGKNEVQFSYNESKLKTARDDPFGKARQWALGYTYAFSKRTNFYAIYAQVTNQKKDGVYLREATLTDASNDGDGYRSGFQLGLKHNF